VLKSILVISLGAAVGAVLRWALGLKLNSLLPELPPGTVVANLVGAYIIGIAIAYFATSPSISSEWRLLIITGFCGGLTTFSTFSAEVVSLLQQGAMDASSRTVSPLRQGMIDDMRMRKLAEKTQTHYLCWVRRFTAFVGRAPDTATVEDLRRFQLHLVDSGTSPVSLNAAITALKFFFEVTLGQGELMAKMQPVRVPRTLPVVLSRDEVSRLIAAARNLKHQTALSVAYGAGLRASEVSAASPIKIRSAAVRAHAWQLSHTPARCPIPIAA